MRKKRLVKNTIASLGYQISAIICGFILPRLIMTYYGSEVNGLVNSITQFLQVITFLELGVGAVVQSSLYKPLVNKDSTSISAIIISAEKFFKRIAAILLVYVVFLLIAYPYITNNSFDSIYTATLIGAMGISSFAQYYFGMVERLLLTADQRGYIQYNAQTITILLNTVACAIIIIYTDASIQMVKLVTSIIYLARPLFLRFYVNKHYSINRSIVYIEEPIKQKWNGIAQHIAAVVLDSTDSIVLTVFSTLKNVSIYSVYFMVVFGIKQLFISLTSGIQSLIGELWARQEIENLVAFFGWVEWVVHTGVVIVFTCTGLLIVPFVSVYTAGVLDANYIQPLFGALLTCANAMHCLRLPYNIMILAGGHYKQTQHNYIIAAIMNLFISIATVRLWGLIGVAIGTLCAMLYQTIWMAIYNSQNFIRWPLIRFIKQIIVDALIVLISFCITSALKMGSITYFSWIILAFKIVFVVGIVALLINVVFYRTKVQKLFHKLSILRILRL